MVEGLDKTLVEIIIVLSLVALLSVVGLSYTKSHNDKTYNTKVSTDIKTIENSLLSYSQDN
jgi:type II secretory pathway pseudopilin PulG